MKRKRIDMGPGRVVEIAPLEYHFGPTSNGGEYTERMEGARVVVYFPDADPVAAMRAFQHETVSLVVTKRPKAVTRR